MNGSNIQNHSLMLSEYLHNIQYIDITIPSNSIFRFHSDPEESLSNLEQHHFNEFMNEIYARL